ncbi:MAG: hypothetical protein Q9223_007287, partial [Gallowayella weberi]
MLDQIHHLATSLVTTARPRQKAPVIAAVESPAKKPRRSARVMGQDPAAPAPQRPQMQPQPAATTVIPTDDSTIQTLTTILLHAISSLHPSTRPSDRAIQEGWMFFLLTRIGQVLKSFVFGEQDELWDTACHGDDIDKGSTAPITRGNADTARKRKTEAPSKQQKQKQRQIKELEAPSLVMLLEK